MSQLPESALPTRLVDISEALVGRKLRVAGRLLAYDQITGTIVIADGPSGLVVDVTSVLDSWVRARHSTVMVMGDLEMNADRLPVPKEAPSGMDTRLVLRAILVGEGRGRIDLDEWNSGTAVL